MASETYGQNMEIRRLRQDTITDLEADEFARLRTLVDPRRLRTDAPALRQWAINELRASVPTHSFSYWGLFEGDTLLGWGEAHGAIGIENADVCEVGIWSDPARTDGPIIRRAIFDHIDADERARGRTRYWGWGTIDDQPTLDFWEGQLGYTLAYDERVSRCVLGDTDHALMQNWIDQASERASNYHLLHARAPFDDLAIEYFAKAMEAMNDAPMEDLDMEPEVVDVARARDIEQLHMSTRSDCRAVIAVETATGELGGYTAVRIPDADPARSIQGDTVTVQAHRQRGIGRWIKADMWQWLRTDRPDVVSLDTGNAESNQPMLAINEAMGFRDVMHHGVWHLKQP